MQTSDLNNILFLDIETVPEEESYDNLSERKKELWQTKMNYFIKDGDTAESIYNRAGIWAEFGKIVCISCGYIIESEKKRYLRVKSFYSDNESELLQEFTKDINIFAKTWKTINMCAHNGKEFDFPFIARRLIINKLPLPAILKVAGLKPWQVPFIDTLEYWKFGDYKHYTSLDLLTSILDIPSPKNDIDGSMVHIVYYQEKNLERIVKYCEQDILAVAQIYMRFNNLPLIEGIFEGNELAFKKE